MRTLAIDYGTKRVGLALSDAGGSLATPFDVVPVASAAQALEAVLPIIQKQGVERIVVGLPLNMDDSIGAAAHAVIAWAKALCARSDKPVIFVDERLSSFAAEQSLIDRKRDGEKITRKRKKQQLDAVAAAGLLQEFLDGRLAPIEPPLVS